MTLYPIVGDGGTSQLILKRLYHSSETRRFLGAKRGTEKQRGTRKDRLLYYYYSIIIICMQSVNKY